MKIRQKATAILIVAFIVSCCLPAFTVKADQTPIQTMPEQQNADVHTEMTTDDTTASESLTVSGNETAPATHDNTADTQQPETVGATQETPDEPTQTEPVGTIPPKAPPFYAHIEFRMGYTVIGTFTDFTPDIVSIRTMHSTDGINWQTGALDWNLFNLGTEDAYKLKSLENQPCLFDAHEPLKSYIEGKIDRFYLKLHIIQKDGLSYETQPAVIARNGLMPIPEGTECRALFSSAIVAREAAPDAPYQYRKYGKYQLAVSPNATAEEISALLPDTLPVEVQLDHGADFIAIGIVDCPVTWKPLSLPPLTPGESITIPDVAEEILLPAGTLISTPLGTFCLEEPLRLDTPPSTDEVRLILNVNVDEQNPTEVLLPQPPKTGGAQGNEGNAGANNRHDSTESGQRPNLMQITVDNQEVSQSKPPALENTQEEQLLSPAPASDDIPKNPQSESSSSIPESASATPENKTAASTAIPRSKPQPVVQESRSLLEQRIRLAGLSRRSAVALANNSGPATMNATRVPNANPIIEHSAKKKGYLSLLALTTVIVAGSCICIAAYKTTGHDFLHRMIGKIRTR